MSNSITQTIQKENGISRSVQLFFKRFSISSALKASNAYKKKGIPVLSVFEYLFLLAFSNRSLYMSLITERHTPTFAKDTLYRFMKSAQTRWIRFTTLVASRIICNAIVPLNKEDRVNVLIVDDSLVERNRSQKWNCLQKPLTIQNADTVSAFVCLPSDGPMEVRFFLSTAPFSPPNKRRIESEKHRKWIREASDTREGNVLCKKQPK